MRRVQSEHRCSLHRALCRLNCILNKPIKSAIGICCADTNCELNEIDVPCRIYLWRQTILWSILLMKNLWLQTVPEQNKVAINSCFFAVWPSKGIDFTSHWDICYSEKTMAVSGFYWRPSNHLYSDEWKGQGNKRREKKRGINSGSEILLSVQETGLFFLKKFLFVCVCVRISILSISFLICFLDFTFVTSCLLK